MQSIFLCNPQWKVKLLNICFLFIIQTWLHIILCVCVSYSKYTLNFEKWMGWFLTERIFVLLLQTSLDLEMPDFCIFLSQDWVKSGKFPSLYIVDEQLTPLILLSGSWSLPGSQGLDSVSSSFWSPVPYCAHSRWGEGESKQGRGKKSPTRCCHDISQHHVLLHHLLPNFYTTLMVKKGWLDWELPKLGFYEKEKEWERVNSIPIQLQTLILPLPEIMPHPFP